MKSAETLTYEYFNNSAELIGIEVWAEHKNYVEKIQQDAIQSLSIKLPDGEVKRIAEKYWHLCPAYATQTQQIKLIKQAIPEALSLVKQGDNQELLEDKKRLDWLESFFAKADGNQVLGPLCPIRLTRNHPDWTLKSGFGNLTKTEGCGETFRTAIDNAMKKDT